jgi:ABC-type transport system involved in multi-copper enzyme maturation permease subunit
VTGAATPTGAAAPTGAVAPAGAQAIGGAEGSAHFAGLLRAEWTKLRSVRSTMWSFLLLVVLTLGFTALFTALTVSQWDKSTASEQQQIMADPVGTILGAGFQLSQLTICVLGVMVMASEYSTGMIRTSLLAVPKRTPMLWAKCVVFATVVFVVAEATAFPSYFIGAAILHSKAPVALGDPGVLRAIIGAGLYLAVLALFALSIGALLRHTAAAITGIIGFVLVLAPLAQLLPGSFGKHVHAYLPTEAGHLVGQAHQATNDLLSPWQGFAVFCLWTAALLAAAAYLLKRRDA